MIAGMSEAIDLFGDSAVAAQGRLFADDPVSPVPDYAPDVEAIRRRLAAALASARAAPAQPWSEQDARFWRTVFPQMSDWLPKDEADALRAAFSRELSRLAKHA